MWLVRSGGMKKKKSIIIVCISILVIILLLIGLYFYGLTSVSKNSEKVNFKTLSDSFFFK